MHSPLLAGGDLLDLADGELRLQWVLVLNCAGFTGGGGGAAAALQGAPALRVPHHPPRARVLRGHARRVPEARGDNLLAGAGDNRGDGSRLNEAAGWHAPGVRVEKGDCGARALPLPFLQSALFYGQTRMPSAVVFCVLALH